MKRNKSDYIIAFLAIACTVVLLGAMAIGLGAFNTEKASRTIAIDFQDVSGIRLHSQLRYAGTKAGRVIGIRPLTSDERQNNPNGSKAAIRVTVSVNEDVPEIPSDTLASIGADSMLGEKHIALTAGSHDASPLSDDAVLLGQPGFSIESLTQKIGPIMDHAESMLGDLRVQLSDLLPRIRKLVNSTHETSASATALLNRAEKLIENNEDGVHRRIQELGIVLDKLSSLLVQGKQTINNTNNLVSDARTGVNSRLDEMGVVLQNLKVVTTHAKAITKELGERPSRLIWGARKKKLTPAGEIISAEEPLPARPQ